MAELIRRDASIRIKLHPDMKVRLEALAQVYSIPPATLAAVWIGQHVAQQEKALGMVQSMASALGADMGEAFREMLSEQAPLFGGGAGAAPAAEASP